MIRSNTCLAVLRDATGKLWFAGDRRITWHMGQAMKAPRPKVTKRNNILFAGTGMSCICDLVTDQVEVPDLPTGIDPYEYMTKLFVPHLLHWLRQEGYVDEKNRKLISSSGIEDSEELSASIIIGVKSDLFELDLNTNIIAIDAIDAPYASGCGGALALGSLLTTENDNLKAIKRLRIALTIASRVAPGCDANIDIIHN